MIDQTLAESSIVLQTLVEVLLLEDHSIVDAGGLIPTPVFAGPNLFVVGLRAPAKSRQQIVADRSHVELV